MKKQLLLIICLFVISIGVIWGGCFSVCTSHYFDECPDHDFNVYKYAPNAEYYCSFSVNYFNGCETMPPVPKYKMSGTSDLLNCAGEIHWSNTWEPAGEARKANSYVCPE